MAANFITLQYCSIAYDDKFKAHHSFLQIF